MPSYSDAPSSGAEIISLHAYKTLRQAEHLLFELDDPMGSRSAAQACLVLEPEHTLGWLLQAEADLALDRPIAAFKSIGKALALNPQAPEAWAMQAYVLHVLDKPLWALHALQQAFLLREQANDSFLGLLYEVWMDVLIGLKRQNEAYLVYRHASAELKGQDREEFVQQYSLLFEARQRRTQSRKRQWRVYSN